MISRKLLMVLFTLAFAVEAEEKKIELDTTRIKANKELPQILYIVPWQDFEASGEAEHQLKLHNLFGELYQPVLPSAVSKPTKKDQAP